MLGEARLCSSLSTHCTYAHSKQHDKPVASPWYFLGISLAKLTAACYRFVAPVTEVARLTVPSEFAPFSERSASPARLTTAHLGLPRACYALGGMAIPDAQGQGHASGSWYPGGPRPLDPGVRRDDVATLLPWTPRSVQHA
jgi:hypothetical protein